MKNAIIVDSFKRIAGIETVPAEPLAGGDTHYRHRAQFKVSAEGAVGFFREGTRDVEPVRQCPLLVENVNDCLEKIRSLPLDGVKEIHVTSSDGSFDDGPSAFIKGREFDEDLAREYADAGFDTVYFDDGSYRGKGYVSFDLSGFKYTVSPLSFFQSNWRLNLRAVLASRQLLGPLSEKFLLDIYAGGGNFSIPLSTEADRITCIEESGPSIKDALRNLELNGIKNMNFIKSAFERFQGKGQKPFDAAIVDPPRPGLSREAVKKLLELLPERLLYISCNPATLARDVKKFLEKYKVETVRLADFFPHTYHMEVICLLTRV